MIVDSMSKQIQDDFTPAEISERIRQIATDAMAKSAVYEDIDSEDKPFGGPGFKRNNVSRPFDSFPSDSGYSVTYVSFVLQ